LRRYRGLLLIEPPGHARDADFIELWDGESVLSLIALGGLLHFKPEQGRGLSVSKLREGTVTVRLRRGGERVQLSANGRHRTLKNLFQESAVPPWRRLQWPLLYSGDNLVAIPGIGETVEFKAMPDEPGLIVSWERFDEGGHVLQDAVA
jgi:tRNA(Ile)-lysidine synthase